MQLHSKENKVKILKRNYINLKRLYTAKEMTPKFKRYFSDIK